MDKCRLIGEIRDLGPEHFNIIREIGKGDVGTIYLARRAGTAEEYAIKVMEKDDILKRKKVKRTMTEREILATAQHPFIVTFYATFQTIDRIYFIMEYCAGGSLFRVLKRQPGGRFPESIVKFYSAEILVALEYLHLLGFIYRDLKPENILIHETGHIKLTDFDLSKAAIGTINLKIVHKMINTKPHIITNSFVGTEEYIAPDIIKGYGYTSMVDWWSFGILIYELCYGHTPFKGPSQEETFDNILYKNVYFDAHTDISKTCKDLILHLLKSNPHKRLGAHNGAADVKHHRWYQNVNWELIRNQKAPYIPKVTH